MGTRDLPWNESVYTLCTRYPELVQTLAAIGFPDIAKPGMLSTVGRWMTLPRGIALKKLNPATIRARLLEAGYTIVEQEGSHEQGD